MKRGPKVKSVDVVKTKLIKLRVTAAEHEAFFQAAAARGMTVADLIRSSVFPQNGTNEKRDG